MIVRKLQDTLTDLDQKFLIQTIGRVKDDSELGRFTLQVIAGEVVRGKRTDNPEPPEARFRLESDATEGERPFGYFFFSAGASSCA